MSASIGDRNGAPSGTDDADTLRVVFVGRGPAERILRTTRGIELTRARDPLDALGEVAAIRADSADAPTIVLVESSSVPADEVGPFLAALKRVGPGASVALLGETEVARGGNPSWASVPTIRSAALDGCGLRALLHATGATVADGRTPAEPAVTTNGARPHTPPPPPLPRAEVHTSPTGARDFLESVQTGGPRPDWAGLGVLRAALSGGDVAGACVGELRRRLSDPGLRLLEAADAATMHPAATIVEHRGRTFGWLVPSASAVETAEATARLHEAASWLALWLALRDQQAQLRADAFTDPLTGAWNRRYFDRYLPRALEHARHQRHELSLLVFDIDNFKRFNDDHGHGVGDEILAETVRMLQATVRPADRVCRIGGDEFAVVFYEPEGPREATSQHPQSIAQIAARFQRQICEQRFPRLGDALPGRLSISGGMATFPWDAADSATLLAKADALALESKRQGKNTITYGPGQPTADEG